MLSDVSVSRQLGLDFTDLLLRTTELPACSLSHRNYLTSLEIQSAYVALFAQPTERFSRPKRY
jgi:hypothetical protein